MTQTEKIKAMIREMMAQEMENFKEAVSNGEAGETASPVVYTTLQVLMARIEAMSKLTSQQRLTEGSGNSLIL